MPFNVPFVSQSNSLIADTQLWASPPDGAQFSPIGVPQLSYSALGGWSGDGYLYGIQGAAGQNRGGLVRIGADGVAEPLGVLPGMWQGPGGLPTTNEYAIGGAFGAGVDEDRFFVLTDDIYAPDTTHIVAIDFSNGQPTVVSNVSSAYVGADFVYMDGYLWSTGAYTINRMDPYTGVQTRFAFPDGFFGDQVFRTDRGMWNYANGDIASLVQRAADDTNGLTVRFRVSDPNSDSPTFSLVARTPGGPTSNSGNGAIILPRAADEVSVDLSVAKTGTPLVAAGGLIDYAVTVTNESGEDSSGSTIQDVLPAGVSVTQLPANCSAVSGALACNVAPIAAGGSQVVRYQVRAPSPTTATVLTNYVQVAGNEVDPIASNNSATSDTTVQALNADVNANAAASAAADANGNPAA
ncbi:DUF11 domain-containing protein, partial [Leifsonia sp. NPDC102414]|uniref:DUF11 domain-containing protein n=1 Tax=Leifsonia sp. NPDC102414 TaxID=3364124 RepID=UPI0038062F95